ncbi:MAG: sugar ABC transporter ATP-binding protein [Clostridiales bacterium]|nr:sugar ABC transporter ATP-binding protein [Clostridiales bacterium]
MDENILLQCRGICKQFNGIPVLKNVDLDVRRGEVHALMGENGAGKSTIIKIITGVYTMDEGQIYIDGEPVNITCRQDARCSGISVIYQELSLFPALDVTENIFIGQELSRYGFTRKKEMRKRVQELIDKYEFDLDPAAIVDSLSMAQRQMVEILKALSMDAKLIIMDEPTASLSASESEKLFETIDRLRKKGSSILYISHRLEEVYRLSDRLTVMRDGENVGVLTKAEISPQKVTTLMIGHEITEDKNRERRSRYEENCLEVTGLAYKDILTDVSFKAYGGEILGIGGLVGSGRTELIKCIYGAVKPDKGTVTLNEKPVGRSVAKNIRAGFGLVPEDRRNEGFIPLLSIEKNLTISSYDKLAKFGIVSRKKEIDFAEEAIKGYDIRPAMRSLPVGNLSGGNQQKVVLGRWLSRMPKVLLLDEPTAGVDVGVKHELYHMMRALAISGSIVIMVSSDLEELTRISDRILVMQDGRFFEEFSHEMATQSAVLLAASGVHTEEGTAL